MLVPKKRGVASMAFKEHAVRGEVLGEMHARPFLPVTPPILIGHISLLSPETEADQDRQHVARLAASLGQTEPAPGARFAVIDGPGFQLRWERHTEFMSLTVLIPSTDEAKFEAPFDALPEDWVAGLGGTVLVATYLHIAEIDPETDILPELRRIFSTENIAASRISDGSALVATDFRPDMRGYVRIVMRTTGTRPDHLGRLAQRMLEIETYRLLALLALPAARRLAPILARIEAELETLTGSIAQLSSHEDQLLLERLAALAAEVEARSAASGFRFAAARAYFALLERRVAELRETRLPGFQTFEEFIDRRLGPARRTCEATSQRIDQLAVRINRAISLLRARVELALQAQNRDLLSSMEQRARLQLRLQETVEGLSVVAVSYYALGLVKYLAAGLHGAGVPIDSDVTAAIALPIIVAGVLIALRRMRRSIRGPLAPEF